MCWPAIRTLPSPAPAPLPDRISLVTILVMRKVTSIARNIHIMGRSEKSSRPTGTFTRDGILTTGASFTPEASQDAVKGFPGDREQAERILRSDSAPEAD